MMFSFKRKSVFMLTIFLLLASLSLCQLYRNEFTPNIKYSNAGKHMVIIDKLRANNSYQFSMTFSNIYWSYNMCLVSIGDLQTPTNNTIDIFVEVTICNPMSKYLSPNYYQYYQSMTFSVKSNNSNYIQKLGVSYFVYYDTNLVGTPFRYYNAAVNSNISKDPSTFKTIQIYYSIFVYSYSFIYQTQIDLKAMVLLNGFRITSTDSITYSISLSAEVLGNNMHWYQKRVNVVIGSNSQIPTYAQNIAFTVFLHRPPYSGNQNNRNIQIYSQAISSLNTNKIQYLNKKHKMLSFNTFVGLSSFHISNNQTFSFSSSIDQKSISVDSPLSFDYLSMSYIIIYSKWCPYNAPYNIFYNDTYENLKGRCFQQSCPSWSINAGNYECICESNQCRQKIAEFNQYKIRFNEFVLLDWIIITLLLLILIYAIVKLVQQHKQNTLSLNTIKESTSSNIEVKITEETLYQIAQKQLNIIKQYI